MIFLSWLLYDILHMVFQFPALGGFDMISHHIGFILSACICGSCRALPFAFGWLIIGECSSIFLNIRWFLIVTGRGASALLHASNVAFAVAFFLARIVAYALGVAHLGYHRQDLLSTPGFGCCSKPLLYLVLGMLAPAYGLNLVWMSKIVRVARGGSKMHKKSV